MRTLRVSDGAMSEPTVPFLPPSARPSSRRLRGRPGRHVDLERVRLRAERPLGLDSVAENKVTTWGTGGAHVAGVAGATFGTERHALRRHGAQPPDTRRCSPASPAPARYANRVVALDGRRSKPKDWLPRTGPTSTPRRWCSAQGPGARRRLRQRRPPLPARRRVAGRRRSPDAAVRHAKYSAAGPAGLATWEDARDAMDRAPRGGPRWVLAATATRRQHRRIQAGRGGRPADARARLAVARTRLAAGADRRQRDVFAAASGEYRGAGRASSAAEARAALDAGRALRAGRRDRKGAVVERHTITSFARAGLPPAAASSIW